MWRAETRSKFQNVFILLRIIQKTLSQLAPFFFERFGTFTVSLKFFQTFLTIQKYLSQHKRLKLIKQFGNFWSTLRAYLTPDFLY